MADVNLTGSFSAVIDVDTNNSVITFDPNLKERALKNKTAEVVYIQFESATATATTAAALNKLYLGLDESCPVPAGCTRAAVKTAVGTSKLLVMARE